MDPETYVTAYRKIIPPNLSKWVLFRHGTVFVFPEDTAATSAIALRDEATAFLVKHGPVLAGTSAGDFSSFRLKDGLGWLVLYAEDGLFNFVSAAECPGPVHELVIGLKGREHRDNDAATLEVIHIEGAEDGGGI